jgi:hypothetical protein
MIFGTGIDGVPSLGARDAYVRVSTGTGALVWSDTFDGPSADQLYEVAVLDGGDILGVGYTEGSLPGFTGNSNDSGILGRWSASGERRFVDQTTSLGVRRLHAVCSDGTGGFYVGGYADGWYAQQNTSGDAVVMRYDAENVRQWVIRPRVAGFEVVHALAPRPGGGVYVLGATQGAPAGWTFLGGGNDGFIEVLDPQGNRIDYAQFGSADYEYIYGLDVSETGLIAISGHTGGSLPGHTDASPGSASAFVAVLNADLDTQWIVQLDTLAISTLPSVAWDAQGRLHAVGLVSESFAGHPYGGLRDQLHLVFDAAGNLLHSAQYGGPNDDEFEDVDIAADGDVVIAGDRIFTGYNTQGDLVRLPNPN